MAFPCKKEYTIADTKNALMHKGVFFMISNIVVQWNSDIKDRYRMFSQFFMRRYMSGQLTLEKLLRSDTVNLCILLSSNRTILDSYKKCTDPRFKTCYFKTSDDLVPDLAESVLPVLDFSKVLVRHAPLPRTHPANSYDEIQKGLYLGDKSSYHCPPSGVTHVVSATHTVEKAPHGIPEDKFLHVNVHDNGSVNLIDYFDQAASFIQNALSSDGKVLVHCDAGISRSVTLTCAYLIKCCGMVYDDAIRLVQRYRPRADPNFSFHAQLIDYSRKLYPAKTEEHVKKVLEEPQPLTRCPASSPTPEPTPNFS